MNRVLILLIVTALICSSALAQPQQSANFRITKSVLDGGGAASSSANFLLVSAFGQPSPIGFQSSGNFRLSSGFLSPTFSVSPLSPIQQLAIQQISSDVRLEWTRMSGAAQYKVYRSIDPLFTPSSSNYLGATTDTSYSDVNVVALPAVRNYYIVTALNALGLVMDFPAGEMEPAVNSTKTVIAGTTSRKK